MNDFTLYNLTHPSIGEPSKHSLYHSQAFRHTLTNNEFVDNVLVAVSLFLLVILLKDIITRIVYMRPRFSVASDTTTYFSQARIVLFDNSFLLRWVRKFRLFDTGHYMQRNHMQYNLVMLATLAMFIAELGLVVPGLPANRLIYRDSDKLVRWESQYLEKGRMIFLRNRVCNTAPILDGPNVKSESSWSHCYSGVWDDSIFPGLPAGEMMLTVTNPEKVKGFLKVTLFGEGMTYYVRDTVTLPSHKEKVVGVGLADNASTFTRNLQRNFELLRNVTGLTLTSLPVSDPYHLTFLVNASQVKPFGNPGSVWKPLNTGLWVEGIVRGILTFRANRNDSQLYAKVGYVDDSIGTLHRAVPLKKTKILIGAYIGTLIPASFIVAFTAGTLLAHILACIFLRSPPGGTWELLQAHGRDLNDRILAGPPGDVVNVQDEERSHEESQEKNQVIVNSQHCAENL